MAESPSALHIMTNRFGDLLDLPKEAASFLNIAQRPMGPANLLHFFIEGRLELAGDLRVAGSIDLPAREATLRPKDRAARRVVVRLCDVGGRVQWTVRDLGLVKFSMSAAAADGTVAIKAGLTHVARMSAEIPPRRERRTGTRRKSERRRA